MSRPSLSQDRTDVDAAGVDTASTKSETSQKSTGAFFYPPLTPPATSSNQAMAMSQPPIPPSPSTPPPPAPHPYGAYAASSYSYHSTPGGTNSPNHLSPGGYHDPSAVSTTSSIDGDVDGASRSTVQAQPTYVYQNHRHQNRHTPPAPSRQSNCLPPPSNPTKHHPDPSARPLTTSTLRKHRPLILLVLFLPLPPLLSIIYLVTGHSIFRRASPSPSSGWSTAPLLSSANAAATGGAILALPLFLLLSLLLHLSSRFSLTSQPARNSTAGEDFFDDESHTGRPSKRGAMFAACAGLVLVLVLGIGGAAGALGVACLRRNQAQDQGGVASGMMLSPGKAAEAGVCCCFASAVLSPNGETAPSRLFSKKSGSS
ncbi:hypothetical protein LshimejAT787_1204850 [Lyophyllum shimeji]|uniref:Uncharacterized protein n=1 Tax=Lyophyllum shimeji TaxID=47721 RepID=A0A9P3PXL3_LYOSH|nr:hypothetical protein LshimejAT787_1204850 [Lyophyllum shimeji]